MSALIPAPPQTVTISREAPHQQQRGAARSGQNVFAKPPPPSNFFVSVYRTNTVSDVAPPSLAPSLTEGDKLQILLRSPRGYPKKDRGLSSSNTNNGRGTLLGTPEGEHETLNTNKKEGVVGNACNEGPTQEDAKSSRQPSQPFIATSVSAVADSDGEADGAGIAMDDSSSEGTKTRARRDGENRLKGTAKPVLQAKDIESALAAEKNTTSSEEERAAIKVNTFSQQSSEAHTMLASKDLTTRRQFIAEQFRKSLQTAAAHRSFGNNSPRKVLEKGGEGEESEDERRIEKLANNKKDDDDESDVDRFYASYSYCSTASGPASADGTPRYRHGGRLYDRTHIPAAARGEQNTVTNLPPIKPPSIPTSPRQYTPADPPAIVTGRHAKPQISSKCNINTKHSIDPRSRAVFGTAFIPEPPQYAMGKALDVFGEGGTAMSARSFGGPSRVVRYATEIDTQQKDGPHTARFVTVAVDSQQQQRATPASARSTVFLSSTDRSPRRSEKSRLKPVVTPDLPDDLEDDPLAELESFDERRYNQAVDGDGKVHRLLSNPNLMPLPSTTDAAKARPSLLSTTPLVLRASPQGGLGGGMSQRRSSLSPPSGSQRRDRQAPSRSRDMLEETLDFDANNPQLGEDRAAGGGTTDVGACKRDYQLTKVIFRAAKVHDTYPCRLLREMGEARVLEKHQAVVQRLGYRRLNREEFFNHIIDVVNAPEGSIARRDTDAVFELFDTNNSGFLDDREIVSGIHWIMQGPDETRRIIAAYCKQFLAARNVMEAVVSLMEVEIMAKAVCETCEERYPGVTQDAINIVGFLAGHARLGQVSSLSGFVPYPLFYQVVRRSPIFGKVIQILRIDGTLPPELPRAESADPAREVQTMIHIAEGLEGGGDDRRAQPRGMVFKGSGTSSANASPPINTVNNNNNNNTKPMSQSKVGSKSIATSAAVGNNNTFSNNNNNNTASSSSAATSSSSALNDKKRNNSNTNANATNPKAAAGSSTRRSPLITPQASPNSDKASEGQDVSDDYLGNEGTNGGGGTSGGINMNTNSNHRIGMGLIDCTHPRFTADLCAQPPGYRPAPEHYTPIWALRNGVLWLTNPTVEPVLPPNTRKASMFK